MNSQNPADDLPRTAPPDWGVPVGFGLPTRLDPLPVDALPDELRDFVVEVSESVNIAVDVPILLLLSVLSAAAGGGFEVAVGSTHREVLAIWTVAILASGERKSAAFDAVIGALRRWESEALRLHGPVFRDHRERKELATAESREIRRKLVKASEQERLELQRRLFDIAAKLPPPPPSPEIISQDATPEALAQKMARQFGRAAILSDEGGLFGQMIGRYQDGGRNVDVYLKGHAGTTLKVDRVGREPDVIDRPVLTVGLTAQPEVVEQLRGDEHLRGVGVLARFLFALAQRRAGTRKYINRPVAAEVKSVFEGRLRRVLDAALERVQAESVGLIRIEGPALRIWSAVHDEMEARLREGAAWDQIRDWGSKAPGAVARIAGCFHLFAHAERAPDVPMTPETVERAAALVEAIGDHSAAVIGSLALERSAADALAVLRWIERHRRPEFSESLLQQHLRTLTSERRGAALRELVDRQIVRLKPPASSRGPGRPPSAVWEVNPELLGGAAVAAGSENSANALGRASAPSSQNFQNDAGEPS